MKKYPIIFIILFTGVYYPAFSQSLSINTDGSTANASAILDVKSTLKGVLIPRMSRTERNAIAAPATGLMIFQNAPDSIGMYYYNGTAWTWILANSNADSLAWRTGGNTGTVDGNHFIGTKDNIPFNIKVNNQKAGRIDHINWNSFFGYQAGNANTSGQRNTAAGYQAFLSNLSGNNNTAIGTVAANSNTTGGENTAMGYASLVLNTVGNGNTTYGFYSMYNNVAGSFGTAVGYQAMLYANNTTTPFVNGNSAFGYEALKGSATPSANTGNFNNALGYQSLWNNSTGGSNTALGATALYSNTAGGGNTAVGNGALYLNAGGDQNTAIGVNALQANTSGLLNTALGVNAMYTNSTGIHNTSIGANAGYSLTTGSNNVFLGYQAGYSETTGSNKLYIANSSSNPPLLYGDFSTGRVGLGTITPGEKLEVNGNIQLTTGGIVQAAPSTLGSSYSLTLRGGDPYVPVGGSGGSVNIVATNNMPSGGSGYGNLGPSGNVNITSGSGYNTAGGNINITAGQTSCWALAGNSHSDVNIQGGQNLVAADASSIVVQGGGTVGVGCPTPNANGGNLILRSGIGTGSGTQGNIQLLNGNVGIGTSAPSSKLEVCGNVRVIGTIVASGSITTSAISCPSDLRYKRDITPIADPLQRLMQMNGVNYYWKKNDFPNMHFNDRMQLGFIAQDVEKIFPEMVFTDEAGYRSVDYSRLTPVLVETIKEQQKQINTITKKLAEIEKLLNR